MGFAGAIFDYFGFDLVGLAQLILWFDFLRQFNEGFFSGYSDIKVNTAYAFGPFLGFEFGNGCPCLSH